MAAKIPLNPEILLDVLGLANVMVSPEGVYYLKSDLRRCGRRGIDVNIENLRSSAQVLIDSGKATMDRKLWLQIVWDWGNQEQDEISEEQDGITARDILLGIMSKCPEYCQSDDKTQSDLDLVITIGKIVDRMAQDYYAEIEKLNVRIDQLEDMLDEEFYYDNHSIGCT